MLAAQCNAKHILIGNWPSIGIKFKFYKSASNSAHRLLVGLFTLSEKIHKIAGNHGMLCGKLALSNEDARYRTGRRSSANLNLVD